MQTVIIVIHLMLVLALIGTVLLQKSEGGGLGMGSGGGGFLSSRGTANVLTRATAFLAAGFFVTSLVLSIIAGIERKPRTIINTGAGTPAPTVPGAPAPPPGSGGGILDTLRQNEQQPGGAPAAPAAPPAAPAAPQAPQ